MRTTHSYVSPRRRPWLRSLSTNWGSVHTITVFYFLVRDVNVILCYGHFGNGVSFGMIPTWACPLLEFQQRTAKSESYVQQRLSPTYDVPILEFNSPYWNSNNARRGICIGLCVIGIIHLLYGSYYKLYGWSDLVDTMLQICLTESMYAILIIVFE